MRWTGSSTRPGRHRGTVVRLRCRVLLGSVLLLGSVVLQGLVLRQVLVLLRELMLGQRAQRWQVSQGGLARDAEGSRPGRAAGDRPVTGRLRPGRRAPAANIGAGPGIELDETARTVIRVTRQGHRRQDRGRRTQFRDGPGRRRIGIETGFVNA